jgi:ABC-type multidrug transport system fused ATPase/permease subunit
MAQPGAGADVTPTALTRLPGRTPQVVYDAPCSRKGTPMPAAITADGLRKRYGTTLAVDGVSFSVEEGEIFGILGPNGAGKTTTVECLQGLRTPDRGTPRVLGLDPRAQTPQLRRLIGAQLQAAAWYWFGWSTIDLAVIAAVAGAAAIPAIRLFRWD